MSHPLGDPSRRPRWQRTFSQREERIAADGTIEVHDPRTVEGERERLLEQARRATWSLLSPTDWYVNRLAETGEAVPEEVTEARRALRAASGAAQDAIEAAGTLEALDAIDLDAMLGIAPEVPDYVRAHQARQE